MNIAVFIAVIEAQYKSYIFGCKHIKIDPSKIYEQEVIDKRIDEALKDETLPKKTIKKLTSFKKYYKKAEGGVFGNKYVSRAKKEIEKGKLVLDYEVIE